MSPLERAIAYTFRDTTLMTLALTHRSRGSRNNERMEFLGDSLLGFFISEALVERFPAASEGELSRAKASLVRKDSLAEIARQFSLGEFLLLGSGEMKSGGARRASILADALEALVAAIYLDGGVDACRRVVMAWFTPLLAQVRGGDTAKDPKTLLQEYLQGRNQPLPEYEVRAIDGSAHEQQFTVICRCALLPDGEKMGMGDSRRQAEQCAAQAVLQQLVREQA